MLPIQTPAVWEVPALLDLGSALRGPGGIAGQAPLAIDSLEWDWKKHLVIRLDLNPGNYSNGTHELFVTINRNLELGAEKYEAPFLGETISYRFARLIYALRTRYDLRVVVIIDEYDKPLLASIDKLEEPGFQKSRL